MIKNILPLLTGNVFYMPFPGYYILMHTVFSLPVLVVQ